jgi:hypothetical protein
MPGGVNWNNTTEHDAAVVLHGTKPGLAFLTGSTASGKTTMLKLYAAWACRNGHSVLYLDPDCNISADWAWNLTSYGFKLAVMTEPPPPDEFAKVLWAADDLPDIVLIDEIAHMMPMHVHRGWDTGETAEVWQARFKRGLNGINEAAKYGKIRVIATAQVASTRRPQGAHAYWNIPPELRRYQIINIPESP